ncbi:hypothetical protein ACUL41_02995 [Virgibacillus natechei]
MIERVWIVFCRYLFLPSVPAQKANRFIGDALYVLLDDIRDYTRAVLYVSWLYRA